MSAPKLTSFMLELLVDLVSTMKLNKLYKNPIYNSHAGLTKVFAIFFQLEDYF